MNLHAIGGSKDSNFQNTHNAAVLAAGSQCKDKVNTKMYMETPHNQEWVKCVIPQASKVSAR